MEHIDTLLHARWIIPVRPAKTTLAHHTLAVDNGRIVACLPTAAARDHFTADHDIALAHHALIPGLVNAHTHAAMTLFRGMADDKALMNWLHNHIWPAEQAHVNHAFVRDGARLAIAEMLLGGTTAFNDMYFFPDAVAQVARDIGMRAAVGLIMVDFPSAWAQTPEDYLRLGLELHDQVRDDPLIHAVFAPHAPYTVSDEPLRRIRTLADELQLPIHMHVHETAQEVRDAIARHDERPLNRLHRLGLLSPSLLAVHMTQLTPTDIELTANTGAHIVHCPESNLKLASGQCPVHTLQQAGINVALGTDGAASNNDLDMLSETRSAALLAKITAADATAVPAATALEMATLNGARALGLEDTIGTLEIGKAADITAIDLDMPATTPVYDPIAQIVYAAGRDQVSDVWVAGIRQVSQGQLTRIHLADVHAAANTWAERIRTRQH